MTKRKTPAAAKAPAPTEAPAAAAAFSEIVQRIRAVRGKLRLAHETLEDARRFQAGAEERLDDGVDAAYAQVTKAQRKIERAEFEIDALRRMETSLLVSAVDPARAYRAEVALAKRGAEHEAAVRIAAEIEAARTALADACANGEPLDPKLLPIARLSIDVPRTVPAPLAPHDDADRKAFDPPEVRVEQREPKRDVWAKLALAFRDDVKAPTRSARDTVAELAGVAPEAVRGHTMAYGAHEDGYTLVAALDLPPDDEGLVRACRVILAERSAKAAA